MTTQKIEKFVICQRCGARILEQVAIEDENGQLLCGECLAKSTSREVRQAEEVVAKQRQEIFEQQRKEVLVQQKRRGIIALIICLLIFGAVQVFLQLNKPEPVASQSIDPQKNIYATQSLILLALHNYQKDHASPPQSLTQLIPDYLPAYFSEAFSQFKYNLSQDKFPTLIVINKHQMKTSGDLGDEH